MAVLGMSLVDALNEVLRSVGEDHITSAPGASDTGPDKDAETLLLRVTQRLMTMGFQENTELAKAYTPDGTGPQAGSGAGSADSTATYTVSSRTITATGAYSGYTFGSGDSVYVYPIESTANAIVEGYHPIASKTNANAIVLQSSIWVADDVCGVRAVGPLKVTVGTDILRVRSAGPSSYRKLVLNAGQVVYDADRGTDTMDNDDTIYLDVTKNLGSTAATWPNISPDMKEMIVSWTRLEYQRWRNMLTDRDTQLLQELAIAESTWARNAMETDKEIQPFNAFSALLAQTRAASQTAR
ncbi:MAG TPA: hypothetical protein DCE43_08060 [Planctomycetaceae bacterium]|nr:hypothetical protein [Planctomycetaceae bacterium]|tara:strand:- start:4522 stop:5415 length:894 start_codon:yes stop_codon:yes gene_type:complete